eukprot:SAG31_NODE_5709_length_2368_cov_12.639048_3_plen_86_part_00
MSTLGSIWEDFTFRIAENISISERAAREVVVVQRYCTCLYDSMGSVIPGTIIDDFDVVHTLKYDLRGKICSWIQEYDGDMLEAAR